MSRMPSARRAYHHGDLRNALVTAAVRLIEDGGTATFSLREAARDVGVSANAAYRHFDDKSDLMTAAAFDGVGRLAAHLRQATATVTGRRRHVPASVTRFQAVGRAYVSFALAHPELFRLMFGECGVCRMPEERAGVDLDSPWTILSAALDALVDDGVLPPERRPGAELRAWSVVHGFASLALDGLVPASRGDADEALTALLDFTVTGLCGTMPETRRRS